MKFGIFAAALAFLGGGRALAQEFVCTGVPNSNPPVTQAWNQRCVPYAISSQSDLFAGEDMELLVAQSFARWTEQPCTDLEFLDVGRVDQGAEFDLASPNTQRNVIGSIDTTAELAAYPDRRLLAITLTRFSVQTGEILDADIVVNAADYPFEDITDPTACKATGAAYDLRNTLVHEIGHLIGFDHVLTEDATMFAAAELCETKKRDLAAGDKDGVCTVYPSGQAVRTCSPPEGGYDDSALNPTPFRNQCDRITTGGGGCSCGVTTGESAVGLGLWVLVGLALRRRRPRA